MDETQEAQTAEAEGVLLMDVLSPREMQVYRYVGRGMSYKATARAWGISVSRVRDCTRRIVAKLNLEGPAMKAVIRHYASNGSGA